MARNCILKIPPQQQKCLKQQLKKTEKKVKGKNGGYRPGSGRKPLMDKAEIERVKGLIGQHGLQVDESDLQKRTRMLRLLDTLYEKGVNKQDVAATENISTGSSARAKNSWSTAAIFPSTSPSFKSNEP